MVDTTALSLDIVQKSKDCTTNTLTSIFPDIDVATLVNNMDYTSLTADVNASMTNSLATLPDYINASTQMANATTYKVKAVQDKKIAKAHDNQDAIKSISHTEAVVLDNGKSTVVNQTNPDYSNSIDYPDSYGMVDKINNWTRINQENGDAEMVHNSGSYIKFDKAGNCTFKITGTLKFIVDGDEIHQSANRSDIINGNYYSKVFADSTENIMGTAVRTSVSSNTIKSSADMNVKGSSVNLN